MVQITRRISPYNHSSGNAVKYIVIHDTGNYSDSASGNANYFNTGDRQASAHYFVDSSSIWQVVEESDAAWHCGDGGGRYGITNHNSIGIEMCKSNGDITEATIQNTIDLVKVLMNKYGVSIDRVVRHKDASGKTCPATFAPNNWARWNSFKSRLTSAPATTPAPQPTPSSNPVIGYGIVTADVLNVRDGAGTNFPVLGTLSKGARVKIGTKVGNWYNIFYGNHGGWISADYVTMDSAPAPQPAPTPQPAAPAEQFATVTADVLNVRSGAGTNYSVIGQLNRGTRVKIGTRVGSWLNIYFGNNGGWISADYVTISGGSAPATPSKKYVNLPPTATSWNVYPTDKAPVAGNQCGKLAPSQFGGLSYEVLGNPQANVYTIQTGSFGRVNIYCGPDTSAKVSTTKMY